MLKSLLIVHAYIQVLPTNSSPQEAEEFETVYLVASHRQVCEFLVLNKSVVHPTAIASCHSESGNWDLNLMRHLPLSHFTT